MSSPPRRPLCCVQAIPSTFPIPAVLVPAISIVCIVPVSARFDAHALASPNVDPTQFLVATINALIASNPSIPLSSTCTTALEPLNLCGLASMSKSWDGLNTACDDACEIPCQSGYAACEVAWGLCQACSWMGCPCPDCDGVRDSCLNACKSTCHYGLHADVAIQSVDGLAHTRVQGITLDTAKQTASLTLTSGGIEVHGHIDISAIPDLNPGLGINPVTITAVVGYACPASAKGTVVLSLQSLSMTQIDLDGLFADFKSVLGQIPFGLGDDVKNWIDDGQNALTSTHTRAPMA